MLSMLGVPCMSLPVGTTRSGLPVGLQLVVGRQGDDAEARLLAAAAAYERAHDHVTRVPLAHIVVGEAAAAVDGGSSGGGGAAAPAAAAAVSAGV